MICPKCGYDNPNGQKYCRGCDVDLSLAFRTFQHQYKNEQKEVQRQRNAHSHSYSNHAGNYSNNYQMVYPDNRQASNQYLYNSYSNDRQQYNNQYNYVPQPIYQVQPERRVEPELPCNGMGTASLVLGIIGLVFCWFPPIGITLGLLALIFGAVSVGRARSVGRNNGRGIGGLVCSCITLFGYIVVIFFLGVLGASAPYFY